MRIAMQNFAGVAGGELHFTTIEIEFTLLSCKVAEQNFAGVTGNKLIFTTVENKVENDFY